MCVFKMYVHLCSEISHLDKSENNYIIFQFCLHCYFYSLIFFSA